VFGQRYGSILTCAIQFHITCYKTADVPLTIRFQHGARRPEPGGIERSNNDLRASGAGHTW